MPVLEVREPQDWISTVVCEANVGLEVPVDVAPAGNIRTNEIFKVALLGQAVSLPPVRSFEESFRAALKAPLAR